MALMNLTINGATQASSAETLGALVEGLGMKPDRVAIELNLEIVPRDQWSKTSPARRRSPGDRALRRRRIVRKQTVFIPKAVRDLQFAASGRRTRFGNEFLNLLP